MSMQAAVYGRIGQDPRSIETRSGKPMAVTSIAVDIGESDDPALWVGIVAFGKVAEDLLRHSKGDLISASGRVQRNTWQQNGEKREQLQVVADAVISARTVRPSGGKRKSGDTPKQQQASSDGPRDRDDRLPF